MGQVYRGRDVRSDEPVAIKVLHFTGAIELERFARETEVLSTLYHPGIVRYIAGGATPEGEPYLVMEWLEGEPLSERLKRTQLTFAESMTLGLRVSSALGAVHRRAIVHRDIKPSNLFLRGGSIDEVTLIDFGIAWLPGAATQLTRPGAMLGTPGYIAPEQACGVPDIDARADVFSLGCVLFRCFSGRPPFRGNDALSVALKIAADDPPRLRELRPGIAPQLDDLVARMLAKSRDQRPHDGLAVAQSLLALDEMVPLSSGIRSVPQSIPAEITSAERRVMCLVLARPREASADATLPSSASGSRERALRAAADRYRGKLEILADGSLVVLLASADAATDLAARAARCALAMRALLDGGVVVVVSGRELLGAGLPTGELIDRAVQLLGSDEGSSSIRIDDVTAGLLDSRFDFDTSNGGSLLRGERGEPDGKRPLLGKPTLCVGRERELAQLDAIFDYCVEDRVANPVLVTAAAGVGKSRLCHEFLRKVEARGASVEVWIAQGDSLSAGSSFSLLAQAIRRVAGILDGEPIETRREKLLERVGRHLTREPRRVAELLGELIGTSFADDPGDEIRGLRQDPQAFAERMQQAFIRFLRAECAVRPVLLVLEDLHWGDLPTVQFIDAALGELSDQPFMVVALARPEVRAVFPRLWPNRCVQELRLRELPRRASERLVKQVLGDAVGADTIETIVERADGHAFYLEELIRAVAAGKGTALPETVLAMVQTRLERLDPEARRVLRAASVFGGSFWRGGVEALLSSANAAAWLAELADQEVIALKEQGRFPREPEYRFRHALVREAAYGMLSDEDRALGHRLAGAWLEKAGETNAMVLAEHFERGDAAEHAVTWFYRAAEHALDGGDLDAVVARAAHGLRCGASGPTRGALLSMQGYVHNWRTSYVDAAACYREALPILPPASVHWYAAMGGGLHASASIGDFGHVAELIITLRSGLLDQVGAVPPGQGMNAALPILCIGGHYELARDFVQRFASIDARAADDPNAVARLDIARCHYTYFAEGDPWALRGHALAAISRGESRTIHMAGVYEGIALVMLGDLAAGEQRLREVRATAKKAGLGLAVQFSEIFLAEALLRRGPLEAAEAFLEECREEALTSALRASIWTIAAGVVANRRGDLDGAAARVRGAIQICEPLSPGYAADALAILARIERTRGKADLALETARQSLDRLETVGTWCNGVATRVACAEILDGAGERAEARRAIAPARDRVVSCAASIDDPALRASYLERVPENARTLVMARAWGLDDDEGGAEAAAG
jgi:ATP/maltotriose-dependent transcriptional regulator MalT